MARNLEVQSAHYKQLNGVAGADLVGGDLLTEGIVNCFPIVNVLDTKGFSGVTYAENVKAVKAVGALAAGAAIYWVTANKNVAGAGDILIGTAREAALSADTHVNIDFDGTLAFAKL